MRSTLKARLSMLLVGTFCLAALTAMPAEAFSPPPPHARVDPALVSAVAANPAAPVDALVTLSGHDASAFAALEGAGVRVLRAFPHFGVAYVMGSGESVLGLAWAPGVVALTSNAKLTYLGGTDTVASRAREAWDEKSTSTTPVTVGGSVIDGAGIGVAIVDSGADGTHPDLAPAIVMNKKYVCTTPFLVETVSGFDKCFGDWTLNAIVADPATAATEFLLTSPTDPPFDNSCNDAAWKDVPDSDTTSGHGTHVAGIVAGRGIMSSGRFTGAAPGASLYTLGAGEGLSILFALEAFNWIDCNHATVNPPIRVVSNSWGISGGGAFVPTDPISVATDTLVADGLVVLFAAGNDDCALGANDVSSYARNPTPGVIGVASYDDNQRGDRDYQMSTFSSCGSSTAAVADEYPDVSAPGDLIVSTQGKTAPVCLTGPYNVYFPYYCILSGTSMATPHTAGIVALLLQANSALTPAQVECVLKNDAHQFTTPGGYTKTYTAGNAQLPCVTTSSNYAAGHGLVDAIASLNDPVVGASGGSPLPQIGSAPHIYNKVATAGLDPEFVGALQLQWTEIAGQPVQVSERTIVSGSAALAGSVRFVVFDPLGGTTVLGATLAADTLPAERMDATYNFPVVGDYTVEAQYLLGGTWRAFDSFHVTSVSA